MPEICICKKGFEIKKGHPPIQEDFLKDQRCTYIYIFVFIISSKIFYIFFDVLGNIQFGYNIYLWDKISFLEEENNVFSKKRSTGRYIGFATNYTQSFFFVVLLLALTIKKSFPKQISGGHIIHTYITWKRHRTKQRYTIS